MPVTKFAPGADHAACNCSCLTCQICVTVTACNGSTAVSGATITVRQGATTIGTCTTNSSGQCCVDVSATGAGSYNVEVTKTGTGGSNKDVTVSGCPGTTNVALTADTTAGLRINVVGCGSAWQGATVTVNGGTYTTDASGNVNFNAPVGTYSYTVTYSPYFNSGTGSITLSSCGSGATSFYTMTLNSSYVCCGSKPVAKTLHYTDGANSFDLVYSAGTWSGCGEVSVTNFDDKGDASGSPVCAPCSASKTGNLYYSVGATCSSGKLNFAIGWSYTSKNCPPVTYHYIFSGCPGPSLGCTADSGTGVATGSAGGNSSGSPNTITLPIAITDSWPTGMAPDSSVGCPVAGAFGVTE